MWFTVCFLSEHGILQKFLIANSIHVPIFCLLHSTPTLSVYRSLARSLSAHTQTNVLASAFSKMASYKWGSSTIVSVIHFKLIWKWATILPRPELDCNRMERAEAGKSILNLCAALNRHSLWPTHADIYACSLVINNSCANHTHSTRPLSLKDLWFAP
jgi:hypothetical protein